MVSDAKDTFPVFEGRMGSRDYWLAMWGWGRVRKSITYARDLPDYASLPPTEKIQRDINQGRVDRQILPYLLTNPDHFFGAIIIEGRGTKPEFKPIEGFEGYGTLELTDDVLFYCLDGQHRLAAISSAVLEDPTLSREQQAVIIVWYENTVKTRKLFTHINKNAKPTTTATNILLDDEDLFAEITRRLEREIPLFKNRTNWKGNTLQATSQNVTTAPVLASSAKAFLDEYNIRDSLMEIPEEQVDTYYSEVRDIWEKVLSRLPAFVEVDRGVLTMANLRERFILMTPVGQMVMIQAIQGSRIKGFSVDSIVERLTKIDWEKQADLWNRIVFSRDLDRMITARENYTAMGRIVAYVLGGDYSEEEKAELFKTMQSFQPERKELPAQVSE